MPAPDIDAMRRYAVARTLFKPTQLPTAIKRLGFVQADPIRAPARAQDLILRHRVKGYRAGDLERRYARLAIEEDCFVNYGYLPRPALALLHPRVPRKPWDAKMQRLAQQVLDYVQAKGATHPKQLLAAFDHGRQPGYWRGELNTSTLLLDGLHYRGHLRVQRRDSGTRVYVPIAHAEQDDSPEARLARAARLVDMIVQLYAPLPAASLVYLGRLLRYGAPQLQDQTRAVCGAARERYAHAVVEGQTWFWPAAENPRSRRYACDEQLRLLAPFDPIAWDRRRFSLLWGWTYKFEAYTPAAQRRMGHYALPILWGDQIPGWANLKLVNGRLQHELGFAGQVPRGAVFRQAFDEELLRLGRFLGLDETAVELTSRTSF